MFKKSVDKRLHLAQSDMLAYAEDIAKDYGFNLDYTIESIRSIDTLLELLVQDLHQNGLNGVDSDEPSDAVMGYIEVFGCYIVESIEKNHGRVVWSDKDPISGDFAFTVTLKNNNVIYPMDWVVKKMLNPKDYSIYQRYIEYVK